MALYAFLTCPRRLAGVLSIRSILSYLIFILQALLVSLGGFSLLGSLQVQYVKPLSFTTSEDESQHKGQDESQDGDEIGAEQKEFYFRSPPVLPMPSLTAKLPFSRWHPLINRSRIMWRSYIIHSLFWKHLKTLWIKLYITQLHGEQDQVVPPLWAAHSAGILANLACDINLIRLPLFILTSPLLPLWGLSYGRWW